MYGILQATGLACLIARVPGRGSAATLTPRVLSARRATLLSPPRYLLPSGSTSRLRLLPCTCRLLSSSCSSSARQPRRVSLRSHLFHHEPLHQHRTSPLDASAASHQPRPISPSTLQYSILSKPPVPNYFGKHSVVSPSALPHCSPGGARIVCRHVRGMCAACAGGRKNI